MLRRINDALPGLVGGILAYGIFLQLTVVWFVEDKAGYSVGLWFGIAVAVGLAINIATVIYDSVTLDGGARAVRRIAVKSVLRYLVVAALFLLFGYLRLGNLFAAFFGLLGLKLSAYAQPALEKFGIVSMGRYIPSEDEDMEQGNNLPGRSDAASGEEINIITDKEVIQ